MDLDMDAFEKEMIPVLKEGYLKKLQTKGSSRLRTSRTWARRYVVIDNCSRKVKYGEAKGKPVKKTIDFENVENVKVVTENRHGKPLSLKKRGTRFDIICREEKNLRTITWQAESPAEADSWIRCLKPLSANYRRVKQNLKDNIHKMNCENDDRAIRSEHVRLEAEEPLNAERASPPQKSLETSKALQKQTSYIDFDDDSFQGEGESSRPRAQKACPCSIS